MPQPREAAPPCSLAGSWRHLAANRDGVAIIEFAFLAPVLVLLLFGVVELSRFQYVQGTVESATAAVLREATIDRDMSEAEARAFFIGQLLGIDPGRVLGFSLARAQEGTTPLQRITVRTEVDFQTFLPIIFDGNVPITSERQGFSLS